MEKITSRRNTEYIHVKKLGASRAYRNEREEFVCDGKKLLREAIGSNAKIVSVFSSSPITLPLLEGRRVFDVSSDILNSLSPLKNSQDVLFVCKMPDNIDVDYQTGTHILLDNVQDPGNVGTIIRSAYAFGIESVILTESCADPYNPKAIRASMGALFRQCVNKLTLEELISLEQSGARFIGTSSDGCFPDKTIVSLRETLKLNLNNAIIMFGNEGSGISEDMLALCSEMVTIPLSADCDSLNVAVAASIIMWEINASEIDATGSG